MAALAAACSDPAPSAPTPSVTAVLVSPPQTTLDPGMSVKLIATAQLSDGGTEAGPFTWAASPAHVARVDGDGTVTALAGGIAVITAAMGTRSGTATVTVRDVFDVDAQGMPAVITSDYIDLARISRVSRFRSGIGHDYSDGIESCRSMKHYFMPRSGTDWSTMTIFAPADGVITAINPEQTFASQVHMQVQDLSAATVILFHVVPDAGIGVGSGVRSGQRLGRHVGSQTMSDIAISVQTPTGFRYVSYFDAMDDSVFERYQARGLHARASAVISRDERDTHPLLCQGEEFQTAGSLENWVTLN